MKYNHEIVSATWNEESGKWLLQVRNKQGIFHDECDMFVYAGGTLKYEFLLMLVSAN